MTWQGGMPPPPQGNRMGVTFYRKSRNDGMEASDVGVARLTERFVFIGNEMHLVDEARKLDVEWWSQMLVSPPFFD